MTINLNIEAEDAEEMAAKLRGLTALFNPGRVEAAPLRAVSNGSANTQAMPEGATMINTDAAVPSADVNPKPKLGPDELAAGMTLKETQSASLGDGTRVAPGDYLTFRGETWHVYKTYRGKVIAGTEDNRFDVLDASDCKAAARDPAETSGGDSAATEPEPVRNGTAAALIAADGGNKIEPKRAAELRDKATALVTANKVAAQQVFDKLKELSGGGTNIDSLSVPAAQLFEQWLDNPAAAPAAQFGF